MRILLTNFSDRRLGGVEAYLSEVIPELVRMGHQVGFLFEQEVASFREKITLPPSVVSWCMSQRHHDAPAALKEVHDWRPNVIYAHTLASPHLVRNFLEWAPTVYFAHEYSGTCISGLKAFKFPIVQPCNRRFGPGCLIAYLPRRCGGRSPLTMLHLYCLQRRRLGCLQRFDAIVTHSEHIRKEMVSLGIPAERVYCFNYLISEVEESSSAHGHLSTKKYFEPAETCRAIFVGRMESLKGGHILLESLRLIAHQIPNKVELVMAGDGPARSRWERKARELERSHPRIVVRFPGWVSGASLTDLFDQSHILVMPSLWPEPFGRVGLEAGARGLPVVAYDVGGVREWLRDGENGYLAPGNPPSAEGLGRALLRFFLKPEQHYRLSDGARRISSRFNIANHVGPLTALLLGVAKSRD